MSIYYVYAYLREDLSPYYVGMGKGTRAFDKHPRGTGDIRPKDRNRVVFLTTNLTKEQALEQEKQYIQTFGLKENGGVLINLTSGGECPTPSAEVRRKMSESHKGKKRSPAAIAKAIETKRRNGTFIFSDDHKQKISLAHQGRWLGANNHSARALMVYTRDGQFVGKFDTARHAALVLGVAWKHIPAVCRGRRPHTGGFVFHYHDSI